jgi:hypothetical protein
MTGKMFIAEMASDFRSRANLERAPALITAVTGFYSPLIDRQTTPTYPALRRQYREGYL